MNHKCELQGKIYVNNICKFIINTHIDLTGKEDLKIEIKKPSGTIVEWIAAQDDECDKCEMAYTTNHDDLNESGNYILQSYIDGSLGQSATFTIYDKWR
jgi:hypothetical protein